MKKKMLSLLLALAMVCSMVMPAFAAETSPANGDQIVILHTNDVHCQIDQATDKDTGAVTNVGYAGVAAYKAEMEKTYGAENVTLVDAGDAIQGGPIGTLSKGSYIVDIMNEVGYDIAIPGNHEFDYGMENFLTLAKEKAEYTYLCSNFVDKDGKSVFEGYKTVAYGDVKVAYVGIDTPETFTKSTPTYFQDAKGNYIYGFSEGNNGKDLYAAVQKSVDAARAGGAKYVVAVGHLGIDEASEPWTSTSVIANTTGIDVLIDGHSHSTFETTKPNKDGKDVVVAQTGTKLANIGKIVIDTKTGKITNELVSGYAEQEPKAAAFIKGINDEFDGVLKKVVAKSDVDLTTLNPVTGKRAVRSAETNLGDLCADAYRVMLGADVAFVNGGGVRENIKAGDITYEDIIKVHPFGNEACMVETTGQQILDALEMGSKAVPGELGGFLQVSGLTYSIDASVKSAVVTNDKGEFVKVDGPYRVHDVMVGDKPLDVKATYTLAAHNYMLKSGGDGLVMFKNDKLVKDSVMIDNQVLINYIVDELGGVVGKDYADPYGQGRIAVKYVGVDGAAWYANAAKYVMDKGLMSSTGSGFDPSGTVTRATVFQVLYNMEGKPSAGAASFTDVDGKWYAAAAAWAESTGLAAVGADKLFNGDRTATRQEVATILARYVAYAGIKAEQGGMAMKEMADYSSIASWALEGMGLCYYNGIITGKPGNLLDPAGTATRAQLATMLMNLGKLPKSYTEETVTIAVPAQNGIPAHEIPAIVTLPAGSEGKVPGVVMLHGTGSDKNEAGGGYALAAPLMAKAGIATIRIDFMGNGASKADYVNYNYTSAKLDAKAAADYLAKLATVDAAKLGVMGWSQGGTDALLAAAPYPDTFKA
ncbi:MAG: multifunctional 2',3'-cyclic-nucleotide 2'-phosphodiesterase/5'-nucleotidase/3'-nucleotidase, partial [Clostridia bacterium]|nr:multifunctional 2',3'-cyclic-nucleotide 2'-phosphodiesterase/5'-nucleotidase/3'-nucleotidase [Clostridia bacterium]